MGIISPEKERLNSKALNAFLLIILLPILIVAAFSYLLWGAILCMAIWLTWRKRNVLFVYSDSPTWKDYIEKEILPHIQDRAVILNWSERKHWKNSLAVMAFKHFSQYRNFNPMAIVFRPFRFARTYRFFEAFKDFKHGDPRTVEEVKRNLFEILAIQPYSTDY